MSGTRWDIALCDLLAALVLLGFGLALAFTLLAILDGALVRWRAHCRGWRQSKAMILKPKLSPLSPPDRGGDSQRTNPYPGPIKHQKES